MSRISLAIIDGTGPFFDKAYHRAMDQSFCKQLDVSGPRMATYYQRGPGDSGLADGAYSLNAVKWLTDQKAADPAARIMLAGYSRGGSTVLAVAAALRTVDISVDSMFLFDAVSRQVLADGRDIVSSVQYCRHAVRSDDPALVAKYEKYIDVPDGLGGVGQVVNPFTKNKMRPWFGHVALTAPKGVDFATARFRGTHGALGGVGWKAVPEDAPAQISVAAWMNPFLQARGVPASIVSHGPNTDG